MLCLPYCRSRTALPPPPPDAGPHERSPRFLPLPRTAWLPTARSKPHHPRSRSPPWPGDDRFDGQAFPTAGQNALPCPGLPHRHACEPGCPCRLCPRTPHTPPRSYTRHTDTRAAPHSYLSSRHPAAEQTPHPSRCRADAGACPKARKARKARAASRLDAAGLVDAGVGAARCQWPH